MAASFSGSSELAKILLEKGADRTSVDRVGKTAMVYAAGLGHTGVVELLLADGESSRAAYHNDLTALMWAAAYGHTGTVKLLLERGADASARDNRGKTALAMAIEGGHGETEPTAPQGRRRAIAMKRLLHAGAAVLLVWGLRAEAQFRRPFASLAHARTPRIFRCISPRTIAPRRRSWRRSPNRSIRGSPGG